MEELRKTAIGAFASRGLPSRRVEDFKYTDLKANVREVLPLATGRDVASDAAAVARALGAHFGSDVASAAALFANGRGTVAPNGATFLASILAEPPAWVADALADEPIRVLVVRPGMVRTRMSAGHKEAPLTCDPEDIADAVANNLLRGPATVWVPAPLRFMMSGLRHAPRPVFRRVSKMR